MSKYGAKGVVIEMDKHAFWIPEADKDEKFGYQRAEQPHVTAIARNFCWNQFGTLIASERINPDNPAQHLAVIDGGNRLRAALLLANVHTVPALVFQFPTLADEAEAFVWLARRRRGLGSYDLQRAGLVAQEREALLVNEFAKAFGRPLSKRNTSETLGIVACLRRLCKRDADLLFSLIPLLQQLIGDGILYQDLLLGLVTFEEKARLQGLSLLEGGLKQRLLSVGRNRLIAAVRRKTRNEAHWDGRHALRWGMAIEKEINRSVGIRGKTYDVFSVSTNEK